MKIVPKYQEGRMINYFAILPQQQQQTQQVEPSDNNPLKYLNFIQPSSLVGATIKKLAGNTKSFTDLVTEGSGIFTEEFDKEHPIISFMGNSLADFSIGAIGSAGLAGGVKLASKAPRAAVKLMTPAQRRRLYFVASGVSGGSPKLGFTHAKNYLKGRDLHNQRVNPLNAVRYVLTGKGKEKLGALYTGGTRPVIANYDGLQQAARYTEVPSREASILQINQGVVDETFDTQKLFQELRRANQINGGVLDTPVKIEGGIIIGSREMLKNPIIQSAIDSRKVTGHRITPVVVSDPKNAEKALALLNNGEAPVYKMSIRQRRIKGERQQITDLEGRPLYGKVEKGEFIPGTNAARGNYTYNTGGMNVLYYKEDGVLRKVEFDIYDHAGTPNSTKYGTDLSKVGFMKKYFSSYPIKQEMKRMLSTSEETSSVIIRYSNEMSAPDFRHAMMSKFKINPRTKQLEVDEEGVQELVRIVGNSKTGKQIGIAISSGEGVKENHLISFYRKQVRDMAKEAKLRLDTRTEDRIVTQVMNEVKHAGNTVEELSITYKRRADQKMGDILAKLYAQDNYGVEFVPTQSELAFMKEYKNNIDAFRRYSTSREVFERSEDYNDWYKVLNENASVRNPKVQRPVINSIRPYNVNAQLRNRADNTIMFINRYAKATPEERVGMLTNDNIENTFFNVLEPDNPVLDYNIPLLYNAIHA